MNGTNTVTDTENFERKTRVNEISRQRYEESYVVNNGRIIHSSRDDSWLLCLSFLYRRRRCFMYHIRGLQCTTKAVMNLDEWKDQWLFTDSGVYPRYFHGIIVTCTRGIKKDTGDLGPCHTYLVNRPSVIYWQLIRLHVGSLFPFCTPRHI